MRDIWKWFWRSFVKSSGCLGMGDDKVRAHSVVTNSESDELCCFSPRKQNPEGKGTDMEKCSSLSFSQVGYNPTEWLLDDDQVHLSGRNKSKGCPKNGMQIKGYSVMGDDYFTFPPDVNQRWRNGLNNICMSRYLY